MPVIEMRENKVLKLTNVLSRKVKLEEIFTSNRFLEYITNWIKTNGYQSVGPLIMFISGVKGIDSENKPIIESRIMLQLKEDNVIPEKPYHFDETIRIENCLMARFEGNQDKMQFATNKLTLFAYENEIELTGESYLIYLKQEEKNAVVDIFMPVAENK